MTVEEREILAGWDDEDTTRFAHSLAASRALVAEKDKVLNRVSEAWLMSANADELWARFSDAKSDEDGGRDLWGTVVEALALTEKEMMR